MRIAIVVSLAVTSACALSKGDGNAMRDQLKLIDTRLSAQEAAIGTRVKDLDESIDKATKALARNSADTGTRVDNFSEELAKVAGKIDTLQRTIDAARTEVAQVKSEQQRLVARMDSIEKQLGMQPGQAQPGAPAIDKATLFDGAYQKLQGGSYDQARTEFRLYVRAFAQDDKADDAAFYIGESFFRQKDYEKAMVEYQRVIDTYPQGDMADDAFFQAGLAAMEMKLCREASAYLGELVRLFPQSPLLVKAKQKLDYAKKNAKNAKLCKPS
jgi:tol-pal system protein YbgF